MTGIKICGLTSSDDAEKCVALGVEMLGINLVEGTPRAVTIEAAREIANHVGNRARVVLVVANLPLSELFELRRATAVDWLQLHGDEPNEYIEALSPFVYKAARIGSPSDIESARSFSGELLLVDAKVPGKLGGTGQTVDFDLVAPLARERKIVLAGGLHADNVAQAIAAVRPEIVDVASGVERVGEPRKKDDTKLEAFVRAAKTAS